MARVPLSSDTTLEAEDAQLARWRDMTPREKSAVISGLSRATRELAKPGMLALEQRLGPDAAP